MSNSIKTIVIATSAGALLTWGMLNLTADDSLQHDQIVSLENRIEELELSLARKDEALARALSRPSNTAARPNTNTQSLTASNSQPTNTTIATTAQSDEMSAEPVVDSQQILRELSTTSDRDSRSFAAKVNDLLATNPSPENIAIVSQGVIDKASTPDVLPDHELEVLYQSQTNADIKRVAAQVLSMRGDNRLIDKQVSGAEASLHSENAADRQKVLVELAKTRYAGAANAIAPLLQDADTGVKLDALLALRATGNQSHIPLVESLTHSSDPAVSWLANDVINSLQNLSDKARTRVNSTDAVADLPVIP